MSTLLETLSSYVPTLVVEQATQDPNYFTKPTKKNLSCVVLFADISGFTTLTERLAKRGPSGAEELTNLLNNYLGKLIDLITSYGGDVVKFAGDALLVLFTEEFIKEDLNKLTERVADCCLRVQKELHNYQVASDVELAIKLIINIGEVSIQTLGGIFGRWELLVTGDPLDQIALANSLAKAGEILLSSQAWELIKEKVEVINKNDKILLVNLRTNSYFPEIAKVQPKATATTAIRAFIPGAIRSRIDSGQTDWLAELRKITVLFINLPDLNHESLEKAQEAMCALQISLYRYEGSINKISVDDKGVSLVAAMGLPPLAHEDDPARGVRAAIAMQEELKKLGLQSSIGITTGQTFCGSVGSSVRREYTIIGDTVNLASRLMQVAQGSILTDKTTAKVASNRLNFTPLEPVTIKGKQQPITIYQPSLLTAKKSKTPSNPKTPIVGRINEIAFLKEKLLLSKQTCKCSSIIIEGEAGIGKSRLTEQLITQAQELELLTLTSEGDSIESSTPYFAWRNVVNQLFQLENLSDADKTEQQTHILRQLPNDAKTLQSAPLLDVFLPWDWVDNEYTAELIGKTRADAVHELLINLLKQASKNPLILVMEDAHWLDSGSWALLLLVCQQIENLITVIVTRPIAEPIPLEYKEIQVLSKTEKIVLNNLSVADTISLVCHRLGVNSLPKQVEDLIIEKSEGNPFFSEELAYVMRDLGFIEIINGECRLSNKSNELKTTKLPNTIQGLITSRVDRLTPAQQLTIKVASVIGRVFSFRTLQDIYPINEDKARIAEHFKVLEGLDLTPLERPDPDLAYIFKHIITRDVVYNLMLFSQRRQLHRAVAEWYEKTYANDLAPYFSYLAYHWCKVVVDSAIDPKLVWKAVDYLQKAGNQAVQRYVNQEAIGFFAEALELLKTLPNSIERTERQIELQLAIGAPIIATKGYAAVEVLNAYTQAQELCKKLGDKAKLFPALRGLWAFYIGRADYKTAANLAKQLLELAQEEKDSAILLEAHRAMGNTIFWSGDLISSQHHMQEGIELYTPDKHHTLAFLYGQDPDVANRGMQAWPLSLMGYPEQAIKRGKEAISQALELSHPYSLGYALIHDGCCQQYLLRVDQALQQSEKAIKLSQEKGFPNWMLAGMVVHGWALVQKADLSGLQEIEQAVNFWRSSGSELVVPYFMTLLAECYSKTDKLSLALDTLKEAINIAEKNNDHWYDAEMYRLKGEILLLLDNDLAQAENCFLKAINIAKHQQAKLLQLRASISLAKLWQLSENKEKAQEMLKEIYSWFNEGFQMPDLQAARKILAK